MVKSGKRLTNTADMKVNTPITIMAGLNKCNFLYSPNIKPRIAPSLPMPEHSPTPNGLKKLENFLTLSVFYNNFPDHWHMSSVIFKNKITSDRHVPVFLGICFHCNHPK